ncbi:MAG TPA: polymer-forming cytoskeletal protein [Gammaproteobacteria bacterium]|nr:polymer-forming cytoskeletal protein [Gammaproteobacteria bacterium]
MWGGNGSKKRGPRIVTLIERNAEITGDIRFSGELHLEGRIKGNVHGTDEHSVLTVSQHGGIEGELRVAHIVLDGTVNGDVHAAERVELGPHARVTGNVYYNLIEMAVGATVNGKLVHRPAKPVLALAHDGAKNASADAGHEPE